MADPSCSRSAAGRRSRRRSSATAGPWSRGATAEALLPWAWPTPDSSRGSSPCRSGAAPDAPSRRQLAGARRRPQPPLASAPRASASPATAHSVNRVQAVVSVGVRYAEWAESSALGETCPSSLGLEKPVVKPAQREPVAAQRRRLSVSRRGGTVRQPPSVAATPGGGAEPTLPRWQVETVPPVSLAADPGQRAGVRGELQADVLSAQCLAQQRRGDRGQVHASASVPPKNPGNQDS